MFKTTPATTIINDYEMVEEKVCRNIRPGQPLALLDHSSAPRDLLITNSTPSDECVDAVGMWGSIKRPISQTKRTLNMTIADGYGPRNSV